MHFGGLPALNGGILFLVGNEGSIGAPGRVDLAETLVDSVVEPEDRVYVSENNFRLDSEGKSFEHPCLFISCKKGVRKIERLLSTSSLLDFLAL